MKQKTKRDLLKEFQYMYSNTKKQNKTQKQKSVVGETLNKIDK